MELIFSFAALVAALSALYLARKNRCAMVYLAGAVASLAGCGPITPPPTNAFLVVFHNQSNFPQNVTVRVWDANSRFLGESRGKVQPGSEQTFRLGPTPADLVEVDAGWGPVGWNGPDVAGFWVFHVVFPSGSTWKEFPVQ